jgi:hypothetical protein
MMSGRVKLSTTIGQFEALHEALDRLRKGSSSVKVDASALRNLLTDFSKLNAALRGEIEEEV